jgi:alkanesulfonate monooxygenase SsuD/methylene tetrahydromethanopterin reductase-like flavin-dependent oxidoreductase (luciferase family)
MPSSTNQLIAVGIGLPAAVRGGGRTLVAWARRAEERGFSTLGVTDRMLFENVEPLVALAAASAVTERIRLATTVLLSPLRSNHALLAKQLASIDHMSGGRLVVGVGVGVRTDDYEVSRVPYSRRGRLLDEQVDEIRRLMADARSAQHGGLGPVLPEDRPELLVGGSSPAAFRRVAGWGAGWMSGRAGLPMFVEGAPRARAAWTAAGRAGEPHLAALAYFCLGPGAREQADAYLADYYGFSAEAVASAQRDVAVDPAGVRRLVEGFREAGCLELILFPCTPDPSQVDRLADVLDLERAA